VPIDEWRGTKRNAAINDALTAKFKLLHARGKSLSQIAEKLGISIGRARNMAAEIRLGKR
jgi:transposase